MKRKEAKKNQASINLHPTSHRRPGMLASQRTVRFCEAIKLKAHERAYPLKHLRRTIGNAHLAFVISIFEFASVSSEPMQVLVFQV